MVKVPKHFEFFIFNYFQTSCHEFRPTPEFLVSCPSSSSCIYTLGQFEGVKIVSRECGAADKKSKKGCVTRVLGGGASASICSCMEDKCNFRLGHNIRRRNQESGLADLMWAMVEVLM